jgi:ABC-type histidine transport system ATPase subunit
MVFLEDGMITKDSSPEEIFSNPKQARTREFLSRIL